MIWLNPIAWVGALLVALPILIHLLGRGRTRVLRFPTLRFIDASRLLPTKRSHVHDPLLLVVRCAIVLAAAAALAGPLFLTAGRKQALDRGLARAIIVDAARGPGPGLDSTRRVAQQLSTEARTSVVVETADPAGAVRGAVAWLERQQRRAELAIVSDFRVGAIARSDLAAVPASIGIATHPVARADTDETVHEQTLIDGRLMQSSSRWTGDATEVQWVSAVSATTAAPSVVVLGGPEDAVAIRAIEIAASTIPVALPIDTLRSIAIALPTYPGIDTLGDDRRVAISRWEAALLDRIEHASLPVARAGHATIDGHERFVITTAAAAQSAETAALVALARQATSMAPGVGALETRRVDSAELATWNRAAGNDASTQFRPTDNDGPSDARWLWVVALALLGVEWWLRGRERSGQRVEAEVHDRAA